MFSKINVFKRAKTEVHDKESGVTEEANVNYAKYLFQLNQDRVVAHASVRSAEEQHQASQNKNKPKLTIADLNQKLSLGTEAAKPVKQSKGYYQASNELRAQVLGILTAKLNDEKQKLIKTWTETYIPQLKDQ